MTKLRVKNSRMLRTLVKGTSFARVQCCERSRGVRVHVKRLTRNTASTRKLLKVVSRVTRTRLARDSCVCVKLQAIGTVYAYAYKCVVTL